MTENSQTTRVLRKSPLTQIQIGDQELGLESIPALLLSQDLTERFK